MLRFLVLMVVLLLPSPSPASSITVEELLTTAASPQIRIAQAGEPNASAGRNGAPFEEPTLFRPVEHPQGADSEDEGCETPASGKELPKVAIIIDDMGNHPRISADLLALGMNLTFSFLPSAPLSKLQVELAWQGGHDILVHMPMEAQDPAWDPGPNTLYLADSEEELAKKVAENLAMVPHAIGINNHMGSRYTEDEDTMRRFLKLLAGHNLLFIDSGTSSRSVAMKTARAMGIRTARRHVFLDNVQSEKDICRQLKLLIKEADTRGWAIGIGHPNEATLNALNRCRSMLQSRVRLVGIHELVR